MERINLIKKFFGFSMQSQIWFASQIGKSTTAVAAMCNNKTQPHLRELRRIAAILDVDVKELLVSTKG